MHWAGQQQASVILEELFHLAEEVLLTDAQRRVLKEESDKLGLEGRRQRLRELDLTEAAVNYFAQNHHEWFAAELIARALGRPAPSGRVGRYY